MRINYRYFIIFNLLLYTSFVYSQKSSSKNQDTIFVYETVTIFDTVHVYDTVKVFENKKLEVIGTKELKLLQLDTANKRANLLIISQNQTATIPINGIILNENIKNFESMKKLSFFGVVLFAFQSMIMAQSDFGISAGGGAWWSVCNEPIVTSAYSPTLNVGLYYEQPLSNNLFVKAELNYNYLFNNLSYKGYIDFNGTKKVTFGNAESAADYHQISIPLQIEYKIGRFKPSLGMEYSYRIAQSWLNKQISVFELTAGLNFKINDKFLLGFNYYSGLTKDYKINDIIDGIINDPRTKIANDYFWRSSRVGLSLFYTLKKNNPKE
jgi:hypothetical protein